MYTIEVRSSSEELWRFNIAATCAGIDSAGEQVAFCGAEHNTSEEFQREIVAHPSLEKKSVPEQILKIKMASEGCEKIRAIIYFITHTLPENRIVEEQPPFAARVIISRDGEVVYDDEHDVNQWGGATIEVIL